MSWLSQLYGPVDHSSGGDEAILLPDQISNQYGDARLIRMSSQKLNADFASLLIVVHFEQQFRQLDDQDVAIGMSFVQFAQMLLSDIGLIVTQMLDPLHVSQDVLTAEFELLSAPANAGGIRIVRHVVVPDAFKEFRQLCKNEIADGICSDIGDQVCVSVRSPGIARMGRRGPSYHGRIVLDFHGSSFAK